MRTLNEINKIIKKHKPQLREKFKVNQIGVFGSYVKGKSHKKNDIDMIVEFSDPPDFFEFIRLEDFLAHLLGKRVDLVTKNALKPLIKDEILKETVYL